MTAVALDSVTTGDAAPTTAPHRISAVAGKNTATVRFTPTTTDGLPIRAWRVVLNSSARNGGRLVGNRGVVCGLDRCGAPGAMLLAAAPGVQRTEVITYAEAAGLADGDYNVAVFAGSATEGWNP